MRSSSAYPFVSEETAMSILFATFALLSVQNAPPPATSTEADPAASDEIVVTAQRLREFRAIIETRKKTGEPYCRVKRSSKDRAFDEKMCAAMVDCHVSVANSAAITAALDKRAGRKELRRIYVAEATTCMRPFMRSIGLD